MNSYWADLHGSLPVDRGAPVSTDADVVVIGAGITGLSTGLLLARAGLRVVVLEARQVGAVTTGRTTGKVSLLQGTKLSRMLGFQSETVTRAYLKGNRKGQAWLLRFCEAHGVPVEVRDAVTFAASVGERDAARNEHDAANRLDLATEWHERIDVPFETFGGAVLRDQAQIDPYQVLAALVDQFLDHGGVIREDSRVVSVSKVGRPAVRTQDDLVVHADEVVLATGTPILDRGLYFAKLEANRSYVLMFSGIDCELPMMLSAGNSSISARCVTAPDGESHLMVGGKGHVVGRTASEARHLDELREWTHGWFPGGTETHAWSAQDYSSHDGIPFVGKLPRGLGRLHLATGYDKWGLSNGVAAALRIAGEILGDQPGWAKPMSRRITRPRGAWEIASANLRVGLALAGGFAGAELRASDADPSEGQGVVGRSGLDPTPVATSTVDGRTCAVVGLCTHLGGVLKWNDVERSWDCPLHGSRFAPDGSVLEGPATRALRSAD